MAFQTVFQRYELKYLLTPGQKEKVLKAMEPYMKLDKYGRTTIRNLYYDTDDYLLIRRSLDKPVYKEKLRIRSYSRAEADSTVFVELKKKYQSVVYKRRISLPNRDAMEWIAGEKHCDRRGDRVYRTDPGSRWIYWRRGWCFYDPYRFPYEGNAIPCLYCHFAAVC